MIVLPHPTPDSAHSTSSTVYTFFRGDEDADPAGLFAGHADAFFDPAQHGDVVFGFVVEVPSCLGDGQAMGIFCAEAEAGFVCAVD
jgi:hypothetical protein